VVEPDPEIGPLLLGDAIDTGLDKIRVGRVWLVSPEGAKLGSVPDATWEAHLEHTLFWNLNHASRVLPDSNAVQNIEFPLSGALAGGIAVDVINSILADVNARLNVVEFLNTTSLAGRFWSV